MAATGGTTEKDLRTGVKCWVQCRIAPQCGFDILTRCFNLVVFKFSSAFIDNFIAIGFRPTPYTTSIGTPPCPFIATASIARITSRGIDIAAILTEDVRVLNSNLQAAAAARFRALHESGCFVLPNPWDIGSAIYLERLGFKALATTSAGAAFSRGRSDATPALPRDEMLAHIREIVEATQLPVNADFQNGYADEPQRVAKNVTLCIAAGVAGLSIEDNTGRRDQPLYEKKLAVERIQAARKAIDSSKGPIILTGRCEAWLVRHPDPRRTAMDRLVAYAEAGADCLYAPGVTDVNEIKQIVKAVAPKPVNVLISTPNEKLTLKRLSDLGVRRISVGSALARVAWGAFIRAAREIAANGTFTSLGGAVPFAEIEEFFSKSE